MPRLPHLPLALVGAALLAAGCGESVPGPQDLASGTQYDFRLLRDGAAGSDDGGDGDGGAPLGDGGAIVEDGAALGDGGLAIDGLELFPDLPLGDAPPPADGPSESPDQAPEDLVADDGPACMGGGDCAVANQPCRKGLWTCLNGQRVCQDTGVNLQNGSACGMNQVCSGGTCVPCEAGKACNPPNVCHLGQIACDSGQPTCVDTGMNDKNGNPCGVNKVCNSGQCVDCTEGAGCKPQNPCHAGRIACASGEPTCADTGMSLANGNACGPNQVCSGGQCNPCEEGKACDPGIPCRAGAVACASGSPVCEAVGNAQNGAPCGQNQVCNNGVCGMCTNGQSCTPQNNPCHGGTISCAMGVPTCNDSGMNLANGASCGLNQVCNNGQCGACTEGKACVPANPCHQGKTTCNTGVPVCTDTLANVANGTSCGVNQVCNNGQCNPCTEGKSCVAPNPCIAGAVSCQSGAAVCKETGVNVANGTNCGNGQVCNGGLCVQCNAGAACKPQNPCHTGAIQCDTGSPVCKDLNQNVADGTPCGLDLICKAGACVAKPNHKLVIESGNDQAALPDQAISPATVRVVDGNGNGVANIELTMTAPPGAYAVPAKALTNAQGRLVYSLRLGRAVGGYAFNVAGKDLTAVNIQATATTPGDRTLFTLVNIDHVQGNTGNNGPATMAHVGTPRGLAVASDGTVYFTDGSYCQVRRISPQGVLVTVAGSSCGFAGDNGPAINARLSTVTGLALDEKNQILYVGDQGNERIRAVDLVGGAISTYAGGANAPGPAYGDNGPATSATFSVLGSLSIGDDGALYVADPGHDRIRRIDPLTNVIRPWLAGNADCTQAITIRLLNFNPGPSLVWDGKGNAFVSGYVCGSLVGQGSTYGVVRRAAAGAITHVAGAWAGGTSNDVPATSAKLQAVPQLARDPAGNLYLADYTAHHIRRVEGGTGRIRTVAGTGVAGYTGEYGEASLAALRNPWSIAFDPARHLYIADSQNFVVRTAWRFGSNTPASSNLSRFAGDGQTVEIANLINAMTVKLVDGGGAALIGRTVTWRSLDPGAAVYATSVPTNGNGFSSASARAGLLPATYRFEAKVVDLDGNDVPGSPVSFSIKAVAPQSGIIFTAVNIDHARGNTGVPGPATFAHTGSPGGAAVAADGAVYFTDADYCRVRKLSPQGVLTDFAGSSCGFAGDNGPAVAARFSNPTGVALDEKSGLLYVNDTGNQRVRVVDLKSTVVSTYAGGGAAPAPAYGDNGPATSATLSAVGQISIGPDGALYISDAGHDRLRRVDPITNVITAWLTNTAACNTQIAFRGCFDSSGFGCSHAWDGAGNLYLAAYICGTGPVNNTYGVLRRNGNGTLTHIAGQWNGNTGEGVPGTSARFSSSPTIAVDSGGSILLAFGAQHVIRRLDAGNGRISTYGGNGTAAYLGDYVPVAQARFNTPRGLAFLPGGHLFIADYGNNCGRIVW